MGIGKMNVEKVTERIEEVEKSRLLFINKVKRKNKYFNKCECKSNKRRKARELSGLHSIKKNEENR